MGFLLYQQDKEILGHSNDSGLKFDADADIPNVGIREPKLSV